MEEAPAYAHRFPGLRALPPGVEVHAKQQKKTVNSTPSRVLAEHGPATRDLNSTEQLQPLSAYRKTLINQKNHETRQLGAFGVDRPRQTAGDRHEKPRPPFRPSNASEARHFLQSRWAHAHENDVGGSDAERSAALLRLRNQQMRRGSQTERTRGLDGAVGAGPMSHRRTFLATTASQARERIQNRVYLNSADERGQDTERYLTRLRALENARQFRERLQQRTNALRAPAPGLGAGGRNSGPVTTHALPRLAIGHGAGGHSHAHGHSSARDAEVLAASAAALATPYRAPVDYDAGADSAAARIGGGGNFEI